jgi:plastocyanin
MNVIKQRKPIEQKNEMNAIRKWRIAQSIMPVVLLSWATVAAAHEQHGGYSAGEPGNPKKPAREIIVEMSEMDYSPAVIEVKRGEQIRFVIRNVGT